MHPRWRALAVMFIVQVVGSFAFLALTVLTPFLKAYFGISTSQIGILVTLLYLGYFVSLTPGGIVTDHTGERFTLAIGMSVVSVVAVVLSVTTSYAALFGGVFLLGLAYGTIPSGTNKGIYDWFPPDQRTVGISIKQAGVMVGGAMGAAMLPWVAETFSWRLAFVIVSGLTIGTLGPLFVYTPGERTDGRGLPSGELVVDKFHRMWNLARGQRVPALVVCGVLFGVSQFSIMTYLVLYLTESLLLAPTIAGVVYTGMQLSGVVARVGLGFLTDAMFVRNKHLVLAGLGVAGFLLYLPLAALPAKTPLAVVFVLLLCVGGVSLGYNGVYLTIASELADDDETGVATAIGVSAVMIGAVIFPPIFGFAVDATGSYSIPLGSLALIMLGAAVSALAVGPVSHTD